MGWLRKILGGEAADRSSASRFDDSEPGAGDDGEGARHAPRRELVQIVLRETMRKHGVPSDWIECRILEALTSSGRPGLHVNFVVREAHDQLLGYVFAFQHSFEEELGRFEPRARDWLLSLGWEFKDHKLGGAAMPDALSWARPAGPGAVHPPLAAPGSIAPVGQGPAATAAALQPPKSEDDIQQDLQALFAIRDAAIAEATGTAEAAPRKDFEPTQPFEDTDPAKR